MAKDTDAITPIKFNTVGGMDESVALTDAQEQVVLTNGSFPFFDGMHQRLFGKKLIDTKPGSKVWGIHQSFNGVCLYGYYVETDGALYFHVCSAPPDLRIRFVAPLQ